MPLLRRILAPAILAVPLWIWGTALAVRPDTRIIEIPDVGSWIFGSLFSLIGILIFGIPLVQRVSAWSSHWLVKAATIAFAGAMGGFLIVAMFGAVTSWFEPRSIALGMFGVLPGAITALIWTVINFDMLRAKEPSRA